MTEEKKESFKIKKSVLSRVQRIVYTLKGKGEKITIAEWVEEAILKKIELDSK
jgi:hypothetical protein